MTKNKTNTKMSKKKKRRSFFEEIEQGKNRFTLDDPMGKLIKEAFDLTKLAKELNQNEMNKSEIARKIVEYFNQDEMCIGKWDSIMYEQKRVVMNLLDQLNQNKDDAQ